MTGLERSYRRLLRWYPRAYRAARGEEMLSTLLDDAPPGRSRPSRRDVTDLVRGGLRQRFRLPAGIGLRVAAVATALTVGAMGATLGSLAVWSLSRELPDDDEARQIIGTAMGTPYTAELNGGHGLLNDIPYAPQQPAGPASVSNARSDFLTDATADAVTGRLRAAGWSVRDMHGDPASGNNGPQLSATRDGLVIWLWVTSFPVSTEATGTETVGTYLSIEIFPQEPGSLPVGVVAGWLLGAAGGWLLFAAAAYRIRRHPVAVRALTGVLLAGALAGLFLPTLVVYGAIRNFGLQIFPAFPWVAYTQRPFSWLTLLAFVAAVTVVAVSLVRPDPQPDAGAGEPASG